MSTSKKSFLPSFLSRPRTRSEAPSNTTRPLDQQPQINIIVQSPPIVVLYPEARTSRSKSRGGEEEDKHRSRSHAASSRAASMPPRSSAPSLTAPRPHVERSRPVASLASSTQSRSRHDPPPAPRPPLSMSSTSVSSRSSRTSATSRTSTTSRTASVTSSREHRRPQAATPGGRWGGIPGSPGVPPLPSGGVRSPSRGPAYVPSPMSQVYPGGQQARSTTSTRAHGDGQHSGRVLPCLSAQPQRGQAPSMAASSVRSPTGSRGIPGQGLGFPAWLARSQGGQSQGGQARGFAPSSARSHTGSRAMPNPGFPGSLAGSQSGRAPSARSHTGSRGAPLPASSYAGSARSGHCDGQSPGNASWASWQLPSSGGSGAPAGHPLPTRPRGPTHGMDAGPGAGGRGEEMDLEW